MDATHHGARWESLPDHCRYKGAGKGSDHRQQPGLLQSETPMPEQDKRGRRCGHSTRGFAEKLSSYILAQDKLINYASRHNSEIDDKKNLHTVHNNLPEVTTSPDIG